MIKTITSFSDIDTSLWDEDCLLLLDIDDTLVIPKEKVLRNCNGVQRKKFLNDVRTNLGNETADNIFHKNKYILVDPNLLDFLENNKNVKSMAITARRTGEASPTSGRVEDDIINSLKELGILFDPKGYPNTTRVMIDQIHDPLEKITTLDRFYKPDGPMVKDGILFCCNLDKGGILLYYYYQMITKPKKIIVIDDHLKNLESIDKLHSHLKCEFELYHFKGVELLDNKISDQEINKRLEYMLTNKTYAPESDFK